MSKSYPPIRTDDDGLPIDPWLLAETIWADVCDENPHTLADLVRAAKADMADVKYRYELYRKTADDARSNGIRKPGEPTPAERFLADVC